MNNAFGASNDSENTAISSKKKEEFGTKKVFSEERVDCSRLTAVRQFLNEFKNLELLHPFDKTYLISSQAFDVEHIQLWLDPLDASQEFMEGIFDCASIMLCICHKGTPIAGVMYFPFTKQLCKNANIMFLYV
ncbi:hypothetical protein GJ496_000429 [Pomphorhynchus laevis]|nr:hypothetical protein GJ496_000429 [Pomphorhynchus laevis]